MSDPAAASTGAPAPGANAGPASGSPEAKPRVSFDEFARLDLRVARVVSAVDHPSADRLFKLQVDDGSGEPRQICAGIKGHYRAEDLVDKLIIIVANLEPRKIRGEESRGMLLAASSGPKDAADRKVIILSPAGDALPGSIVS